MAKETIGEYLRRERELRQITLEEMVHGTKIALQRLKELENDRLEDMPAEIFVRGFIKSYAEFIGLNPDEVILRYEEELKALQEKEATETGSVYNCADMKPQSNVLGIIVTVVILFALAAAGYWFFLKSDISFSDIFSGAREKAKVIRLELGDTVTGGSSSDMEVKQPESGGGTGESYILPPLQPGSDDTGGDDAAHGIEKEDTPSQVQGLR